MPFGLTKPAAPMLEQRPVQLQINNSGAWKTLVRFDAQDGELADKAHAAGQLLGEINPGLTLRIATAEAYPCVLVRWSAADGWTNAKR